MRGARCERSRRRRVDVSLGFRSWIGHEIAGLGVAVREASAPLDLGVRRLVERERAAADVARPLVGVDG
jgi:hypothetical protein